MADVAYDGASDRIVAQAYLGESQLPRAGGESTGTVFDIGGDGGR